MILKRLHIANFRALRGTHTIDFDRPPGLYLVTGRNEVDKELAENGVGKTTLFDALRWLLHGETAEGVRGSNACSWGAKSCEVRGEFADLPTIVRTVRPNAIKIDGEVVDQTALDKLIVIDAEALRHSIIIPQKTAGSFLDLRPAQRLTVVSTVLSLDRWTRCADEANSLAKQVDGNIVGLQTRLDRQAGSKAEAERQLAERRSELAMMQKSAASERRELASKRQASAAAAADSAVKAANARKAMESAKVGLGTLEAARKLIAAGGSYGLVQIADRAEAKARGVADAARERLDAARRLAAKGECPTCAQRLSAKAGKDLVAQAAQRSLDADKAMHTAETTAVKAVKEWEKAKVELAMTDKQIGDSNAKLIDLRRKLADIENDQACHESQEASYKRQIAELDKRMETAATSLKAIEDRIAELIIEGGKLGREKAALEKEMAGYKFWVGGFKDVRLLAIENALGLLRAEVDGPLSALGLGNWSLDFDIERETKSGGSSAGFHVFVRSTESPGAEPWEVWSGGEKQRMRIAATMGMSAVILGGLAIDTNIEVWDEPCMHMSGAGIDALMEALHDRALALKRQVWLIEHRAINYGFDGTVRIIKRKSGVEIIER